jgi:hypothetical protein
MLPIQALKFARLFRKVTDLTITQKDAENFVVDLFDSRREVEKRGEDVSSFNEAESEYLRADEEGRLKIVGPDSSVG